MNNVGRENRFALEFGELPQQCRAVLRAEANDVLAVPKLYVLSCPEDMPQGKKRLITLRLEKVRPIARPLLIDMSFAALKRNRGRENDNRRKTSEALNKGLRICGIKVLGDFKTKGKVEPPIQMQRLCEIMFSKWRNTQSVLGVRPRTIDAEQIAYPEFPKYG